MGAPYPSVNAISKCSTIVDYVQFKKWEPIDLASAKEHFQVSASYAMAIIFDRSNGGYMNSKGTSRKLSEIATSFFLTSDKVRLGCYNYGHGIVYEGCWVTYDDKVMCGSSMQKLPTGKSFTVLCEDRTFQKWFTKVLNGAYKEYDFDTLSPDILKSLTSPKLPGSLASERPAGLSPTAGPSIPNNHFATRPALKTQAEAPAHQGPAGSRPSVGPSIRKNQDATTAKQAPARSTENIAPNQNSQLVFPMPALAVVPARTAVSTSPVLTNPTVLRALARYEANKAQADARLSTSNNVQAATDQAAAPAKRGWNLTKRFRESVVTAKKTNATAAKDRSQLPSQADADPLAAGEPSDKATLSTKRKNASPSTGYSDKRTKTGPPYQRQEVINIASDDEDNVNPNPDYSQSSSNATQTQELMKKVGSLKLSESLAAKKIEKLMEENTSLKLTEMRAVEREKEALDKIEKLMEENTNLKLSEMRAVNRANEALGKLRAANRANEELGGNDGLVGQIEELMRENASLKISALRLVDGTSKMMDKDEGRTGGIKNEGITQKIKNEDLTGQLEE
ncbi:hypothetical protein VF21_06900 [Pseudogymnoascus sp. 05NY08]|nr:hypothetical protein VF21_06900 [Pseudogymnoascus sp. 05NY08]